MQTAERLIRKQFLISTEQDKKLKRWSQTAKLSAGELVRLAIDAYDPEHPSDLDTGELLELVSTRVQEAITDTRNTLKTLDDTFNVLGLRNPKREG